LTKLATRPTGASERRGMHSKAWGPPDATRFGAYRMFRWAHLTQWLLVLLSMESGLLCLRWGSSGNPAFLHHSSILEQHQIFFFCITCQFPHHIKPPQWGEEKGVWPAVASYAHSRDGQLEPEWSAPDIKTAYKGFRLSVRRRRSDMKQTPGGTEPPLPVLTRDFPSFGSDNSRSLSSMSIRTTAGLEVKKTRMTPGPRPATARPGPRSRKPMHAADTKEGDRQTVAGGRAQPAVSPRRAKNPSPERKQRSPHRKAKAEAPTSRAPSTTSPLPTKSESDVELHSVTENFGRIRINLMTKEKREAREQAAEKAKAKTKSLTPSPDDTPTLPITPKFEDRVASADRSQLQLPTPGGPIDLRAPSTPDNRTGTFINHSPSLVSTIYISGPDTGSPEAQGAAAPPADTFIPCQPEGPPPKALPVAATLEWVPPNQAETPHPSKKGHNFTSTSRIPFAESSEKKRE
jgi:hypothetical protein